MSKVQVVTRNEFLMVDWRVEWANNPEIHLVKGPKCEQLKYWEKKKWDSSLYLGTEGVYACFYVHDPKNETGFYGDVISLNMADGSKREIKGPWQSRASVFNMFLKPSEHITEVQSAPKRAMRVEWIKAHLPEDVVLVQVVEEREIFYYPAPKPGTDLYKKLIEIKPEVCLA